MPVSEHFFGNESTDLKLSLVEKYLGAFTTALRGKFRTLIYIDAFAGTGERTEVIEARETTLIDSAAPAKIERRRGSAKIALDVTPSFDKLIFIDKDQKHCEALQYLKAGYPGRAVEIRTGSADDELKTVLKSLNRSTTRGVLFLDPYGMNVSWETLEEIRRTSVIDVWYLVSLSGLWRQAALDGRAIDESKRAAITRMLGTPDWETDWYERREQPDLFGEKRESYTRVADADTIERYVHRRLETLFPKVLKPLRLSDGRFSLFFAISNPNQTAVKLATKIAGEILRRGNSSHVRPR